jgi:hypothetical protein
VDEYTRKEQRPSLQPGQGKGEGESRRHIYCVLRLQVFRNTMESCGPCSDYRNTTGWRWAGDAVSSGAWAVDQSSNLPSFAVIFLWSSGKRSRRSPGSRRAGLLRGRRESSFEPPICAGFPCGLYIAEYPLVAACQLQTHTHATPYTLSRDETLSCRSYHERERLCRLSRIDCRCGCLLAQQDGRLHAKPRRK